MSTFSSAAFGLGAQRCAGPAALSVLLALVIGCGSSPSPTTSTPNDAEPDASADVELFPQNVGDSRAPLGPPPTCPAACPPSEPTDGTPCAVAQDCRYGSDPRPQCRATHRCMSGAWQALPLPSGCTDPVNGSACPPDMPANGAACGSGGTCFYPSGECTCTGTGWACSLPLTRGCPLREPNPGQPCAQGLVCGYPSTPCGWNACLCGVWVPGATPCE